jgi:hypothetical protein|tara:strand:- start:109 stop:378 length:270 start_codon:yes stop_codon:yes gene_type:complete
MLLMRNAVVQQSSRRILRAEKALFGEIETEGGRDFFSHDHIDSLSGFTSLEIQLGLENLGRKGDICWRESGKLMSGGDDGWYVNDDIDS